VCSRMSYSNGGMGAAGFRDDSSGMDMGIIFCLSVAPVFDSNQNGYEIDIFFTCG
jgi:hypothetical protein